MATLKVAYGVKASMDPTLKVACGAKETTPSTFQVARGVKKRIIPSQFSSNKVKTELQQYRHRMESYVLTKKKPSHLQKIHYFMGLPNTNETSSIKGCIIEWIRTIV